jgi:hypothetical protein
MRASAKQKSWRAARLRGRSKRRSKNKAGEKFRMRPARQSEQ